MNKKLQKVMALKGDTQQDLAEYLGLRSYVSICRKMNGVTSWSDEQISKICKKYRKTKEELGF